MIYETDTDLTYIWGGSAWQQVSGGTAVGNSGLVYISTTNFSGATAGQFLSCFSSAYTNYRAVFSYTATSGNAIYLRFIVGSTVQTDNILSFVSGSTYAAPATFVGSSRGDQYALFAAVYPTYPTVASIDFFSPQVSGYTSYQGFITPMDLTSSTYSVSTVGRSTVTTQIDGFEITAAGGTNIAGSMTLYGYRKA